jgi:uncharacterized protein (TIGR03437 family)
MHTDPARLGALPSAIRRVTAALAAVVLAASLSLPARADEYLSYVAGNVRSPRIGRDANGFLYLAGIANSSGFSGDPIPHCPEPPCRDEVPTRFDDVVVMKVDPSNGEILYRTYLSASLDESVVAMAVSSEGVVYLSGYSNSPDLPVAPDTEQPSLSDAEFKPYLARIEPNGVIGYLSYLGGAIPPAVSAMAVNSRGELLLTGESAARLPATAGTVDVTAPDPEQSIGHPFVMKLNATANEILFRAVGVGGTHLAVGPDDLIYVAGTTTYAGNYPTTPGAFQTSFERAPCSGGFFKFPCTRQYITKLDGDGARIFYSTFVAADRGETLGGLAADAAGNAYLTGRTTSEHYPTSDGALQPENRSRIPTGFRGDLRAHTAYLTKLAPDGASLVYSTYLGGIGGATGYAIAVDAEGVATVAGETSSRDFPGIPTVHPRCAPNDQEEGEIVDQLPYRFLVSQAFVVRVAADGASLLDSRLFPGAAPRATAVVLDGTDGAWVLGETDHSDLALTPNVRSAHPDPARTDSGVFLARTEPNRADDGPDIDCVFNSASFRWAEGVLGGQLLTLIGAKTGISEDHYLALESGGVAPRTLGGARVLFDGEPGFLLYAGPEQINVQVPLRRSNTGEPGRNDGGSGSASGNGSESEEASEKAVRMDVEVDGEIIHSRVLPRTAHSPAVFTHLDEHVVHCRFGEETYGGIYPRGLLLNEDGALNSCENPAQPGSVLTFFFTGPGGDPPGVVEGALHKPPLAPVPADVKVTVDRRFPAEILFAGGADGHVSGVWRVRFRLPETVSRAVVISLEVGGISADPLEFSAWAVQ